MNDPSEREASTGHNDEYAKMLLLDELESTLEELEESTDDATPDNQSRLADLGLSSREELVERIASLHAELDSAED
jgi:hypothetical protein